METKENINDDILFYSAKAKYYNELLIEQCENFQRTEPLCDKKEKSNNNVPKKKYKKNDKQ